jgi:hypothetical protein
MAGPRDRLRIFQRRDIPVFGGNCLPLTMHLAKLAKQVILPALKDSPPDWAYEDRVVAMLAPSLRENVEQFHEGHGADLATMFRDHQIEHIDKTLVEALRIAIARLSPEMVVAICRGSQARDRVKS